MARHYFTSEPVPVRDLRPGIEVLARRMIVTVVQSATQAVVTFDDGTSETFDLAGDPAVEVVTAGLRD